MSEEYAIDRQADAADGALDGVSPVSEPNAAQRLVWGLWRPGIVLLVIGALIVIARPAQWLDEVDLMREWIQSQGLWALALVLALYMLAAVALVPQTALKIAAGGLFGSWLGVVMASLGSTLGAVACFLLARYVARGALMQRLKQGPRMTKLDKLSRERGTMLVVLSRLLPIFPGNLLNYALGLTQLRLFTFAFWSWLCMLPGVVILVVGTEAVLRGLAEGHVPWGLVGIVVAMLALMVGAVTVIRIRLRQEEADLTNL